MADEVKFNIEGLPALSARLDGLSYDLKRKGGRFALRKAANLLRDKAKDNAARLDDSATAQSIADNVAVRWSGRTFKRTGNLMFRVGVMYGAQTTGTNDKSTPPTPHWRLLEFGTEKMRAQPFMRPAMSQNLDAISAEFVSQYNKAIDRALKKAAKGKA